MILFTKDGESKHMLLNTDLIAICISCLESSIEIKNESAIAWAKLAGRQEAWAKLQGWMTQAMIAYID